MKIIFLLLGFIFQTLCVSSTFIEKIPATPCNSTMCKLPDCYCSGTDIPGDLSPSDTPQFVLLAFGGAVTIGNMDFYREALKNRKNPNNCPISATFFVSHEFTDYTLVHELNAGGHEISLDSMSRIISINDWTNASFEILVQEFVELRTLIAKFANMTEDEIKGLRPPFSYTIPRNNLYQMMLENDFLYDSSHSSLPVFGLWPYTLEYISIDHCANYNCPTESFPNVWRVTPNDWEDQDGNVCAMLDACINIPNTSDGLLDWMKAEFNKQYTGNRAPVGLYTHAAWFNVNEARFDAYKRFLDYLGTLKDVYIVKSSQVIDWMRLPKTVDQMLVEPIICHKVVPQTCSAKTCRLIKEGTEERYMTACMSECPNSYPWFDNPLGDK